MQDQDEPVKKQKKPKKKATRRAKRSTAPKAAAATKKGELKESLRLLLTATRLKCVEEDANGRLSVSELAKVKAAFKALGGEQWADEMVDQLEKVLADYSVKDKIMPVIPF